LYMVRRGRNATMARNYNFITHVYIKLDMWKSGPRFGQLFMLLCTVTKL